MENISKYTVYKVNYDLLCTTRDNKKMGEGELYTDLSIGLIYDRLKKKTSLHGYVIEITSIVRVAERNVFVLAREE